MKSIRSLEQNMFSLIDKSLINLSDSELEQRLHEVDDRRLWVVAEALRRGTAPETVHEITKLIFGFWTSCCPLFM